MRPVTMSIVRPLMYGAVTFVLLIVAEAVWIGLSWGPCVGAALVAVWRTVGMETFVMCRGRTKHDSARRSLLAISIDAILDAGAVSMCLYLANMLHLRLTSVAGPMGFDDWAVAKVGVALNVVIFSTIFVSPWIPGFHRDQDKRVR